MPGYLETSSIHLSRVKESQFTRQKKSFLQGRRACRSIDGSSETVFEFLPNVESRGPHAISCCRGVDCHPRCMQSQVGSEEEKKSCFSLQTGELSEKVERVKDKEGREDEATTRREICLNRAFPSIENLLLLSPRRQLLCLLPFSGETQFYFSSFVSDCCL